MARKRRHRRNKKRQTFRDRLVVNLGIKVFVGFVVILSFLTLVQCTVKKPEAPTWTAQFHVPLIDRTYDMEELIEKIDDPSLSLDSAGNPFFSIDEEVDSIGVNADMSANPVNFTASEKIGALNIAGEDIPPQVTPFVSLVTAPGGIVPPASFDFVYDGPVVSNYSWVTVNSGSMECLIVNNLGVPLDTVIVEIFDLNTFQSLGTGQLNGTINHGSADTVSVPMSGVTMTNRLRMQVHAYTPGGVVLTTNDKDITVDMDLSDPFSINEGSAITPAIDKHVSQKSDLGSDHLVESATLSTGSLTLDLLNSALVDVDFTVTIPDVKNGGAPLTIVQSVSANSMEQINLDLSGYTVEPSDQVFPQELDINFDAHIDSSGAGYIQFNADDSLEVDASISNLSFSQVRGVFDSVSTAFSPVAQSIDVPEGFDSAQFTAASMTLEVENGSELDGTLSVTVLGNNGKQLNLSGAIASGSPSATITTEITESNLSDFLDPIPSSYTVNGTVTFGDGVSTRTVTQSDFVKARVRIESPLEVIFDGSTVTIDPESSDIDTADIDIITNHVINAEVSAQVSNHLPSGLQVEIVLSGDSATLYTAPELRIGPISVAAGQLNGSGITIGSTLTDNIISLDSVDVQVLTNDTLFIGQLLTIESTGGQPVRFMGDDFVSVNATVVVEYKFNDDF